MQAWYLPESTSDVSSLDCSECSLISIDGTSSKALSKNVVKAFGPTVEMLAIAAMESARLHAMDALHIATAQHAQVDLFVTADRRQASVARAVGLTTELIGEKEAP